MTDWDLLTPGIGLTSIGIVGVGISLAGIAKTFIDGMHAVSLLTMFIGMIFLATGLLKDGFPSSGRAKSATFITLGFLVTFGFAAAVTVSTQVPSIYAYIGLMLIIGIPASVLTVASSKQVPYLKALAVIFIGAAIVGGTTFYAFGLVTPKPPAEEAQKTTKSTNATNATGSNVSSAQRPANVVPVKILAGASAQGNPDFDPDPATVKKADGVEWTNMDNTPHTVTSKKEGVFDSKIINANAKWLLDTAKLDAGDYQYYCQLHPFMNGLLKVTAGGGASSAQSSNNITQSGNVTQGTNATAGSQSSNQSGLAAENRSATIPAHGGTVTSVSIVVGASVPTNGQFFSPEAVNTTVGSMVTWKDEDNSPHTVTSGKVQNQTPTPDKKFDSGILNNGNTFSFVFDTAGDYPYYCSIHPWMHGKVTVK
jgi:plastocyanin